MMNKLNFIKLPFLICLTSVAVSLTSCTESFEERCKREAREYTEKQCPRQLDNVVTIDSMSYENDPQGFVYYYTVNDIEEKFDSITEEVRENFTSHLRDNVRKDLNMKTYKERNFTFTYRYYSRATGELLINAVLTPEDYR